MSSCCCPPTPADLEPLNSYVPLQLALNEFADLTWAEFQSTRLGLKPELQRTLSASNEEGSGLHPGPFIYEDTKVRRRRSNGLQVNQALPIDTNGIYSNAVARWHEVANPHHMPGPPQPLPAGRRIH